AYDNAMETFPNSVVAKLFSFKQIAYFEIEEAEKEPVQVDFN
ncbi:MAG TPA: LemA family protein, partial [Actinobacteria bacterium]|nr:LemA family protein [Actinomycetota bacterium]